MNGRILFFSVLLLVAVVPATRAQSTAKITICHIDEVADIGLLGNVIRIPVTAWPGHQRHSDYEVQGLAVGDPCGIIE
jgi:hypothetical protein